MNNILIAYVTVRTKCASLITCNYYHIFLVRRSENAFRILWVPLFPAFLRLMSCSNCKTTQWVEEKRNKHTWNIWTWSYCFLLMSVINDIMHGTEVVWPLIWWLFRVWQHQSNCAFLRSIPAQPLRDRRSTHCILICIQLTMASLWMI